MGDGGGEGKEMGGRVSGAGLRSEKREEKKS